MASLSIPPPPAPTSTRLDWGHGGERGSAFRGVSRGRGSTTRGERGRGGRGGRRGGTSTRGNKPHDSPPIAMDNANTTTTTTEPAQPSAVLLTNPSTSTKNPSSLPRSAPSLDLPAKPKVSARRASQHAANNLPSLTIEPASPTVNPSGSTPHSASTSSSRPPMRSRRSQNKPSGATLSSENLTVEALASAMKARKSRTSPSSPHGPPKASASKDAPPHLSAGPTVTSFSTKTNIDSLVEHVRALAMDHRPSTPGSHIDWAGDEDDSLPDLNDWGVVPGPPKASASKDAPPHLSAGPTVTSFSTKTNVDSLVEHVRALAMDHRPSTPGSHIDWAGDEDDNLPDLDDWGVVPASSTPADPNPISSEGTEKARLQLMSPILDDSLKQLPQSFDKTSPSPSAGSGAPSPRKANTASISGVNGLEDGHATGVSDTPSLPIKVDKQKDHAPISSEPSPTEGSPISPEPVPTSKGNDTSPHPSSAASDSPEPASSTTPPIPQSGRGLGDSIHAPPRSDRASSEAPPEAPGPEFELDVGKRGLAASIHAPKSSSSSESRLSDEQPRVPTHGRSRTLGRPNGFPGGGGAKHGGFLSGSSTPTAAARGNTTKGPHHARTQSTPASHRQRQHRPVITNDAMSRLARTLGTTPSAKKEGTTANTAASSE